MSTRACLLAAAAAGFWAVAPHDPGVAATSSEGPVASSIVAFTPLVPARLLDTRSDESFQTVDGSFSNIGVRPSGSTTRVRISGRGGVPEGVAAVALQVSAVEASVPGFVTVFPCSEERPNTATVSYAAGATISNLAITEMSEAGEVCVFTLASADIVLDVSGFYDDAAQMRMVTPARLLETRSGPFMSTIDGRHVGSGELAAGSVTALQAAGRAGIEDGAAAAILNVTVVDPGTAGFVTLYPCGQARPNAATLTHVAGSTISNAAVVQLDRSGQVCVFTLGATDLTVDVTGYHPTGTFTPPPQSTEHPRVLMIGDSTLAALVWYPAAQSGLVGLDYELDAASCRAVTARSCLGRPDPRTGVRTRPANALEVLLSHAPGTIDELVLMVGYDEAFHAFEASVPTLLAAARAHGVQHVTWLTFRTDVSYVPPLDARTDYSYRSNNRVLSEHAATSAGYLSLLDWNAYVNATPGLVESDGVHLTFAGAARVAEQIRAFVLARWSSAVWPARVLDTRTGPGLGTADGVTSGAGVRRSASVTELPVTGRVSIDRGSSAVLLNVTVTEPVAAGFVTVFPCGSPRPNTASVTFAARATVSAAVISGVSPSGAVCVYTMSDTHLVVDASGFYAP